MYLCQCCWLKVVSVASTTQCNVYLIVNNLLIYPRREREEQRKREAIKAAMLQNARNADSYLMTPPPAQTRKPATSENYDISDIRSDESTDDEEAPRKKVPYWAQGIALKSALLQQDEPRRVFEELASGFVPHAPDLEKIFTKKRKRFYQRTSSAHWSSPPIKV